MSGVAGDNSPGTADPVGDGSAAGGVGLEITADDLMTRHGLIEEEEGNTVKSVGFRDDRLVVDGRNLSGNPAASLDISTAHGLQVELEATEMCNGTEEAVSCPDEKQDSVENVNNILIGGSGQSQESSGSVPHLGINQGAADARAVVGETEVGGTSVDGSVWQEEGNLVPGEEAGTVEPVPIGDMVQNRDIHSVDKNPMDMGDFTTLGTDAVSRGEECWFDDDLMGPEDFVMPDVGPANVFVDQTSKNADTLLVDENVMDKGDAFMADAGSVAVAPVVGSQSEDTHLIEEKSNDNSLVMSTPCFMVEAQAKPTHMLQPIDENLMVKGDFKKEELTTTPETSEPSEIRAIALKGNQSFDMLISDNHDTVRNVGADAHGVGTTEAESGDQHLVADDLMEPGDFVTVKLGSAGDLPYKRLQKADIHLVDENVIVKCDTSMEDAGSVAVASAISPKREDTHLIVGKNYDNYLVTSTSCLVIESQVRVTQPIDENLMAKGDFEDELIPIVKSSMPETSEPLEIRVSAIEGKRSFDFLIPGSQETAALSTVSLANGNDGADGHGVESSEVVSGDEPGDSATADVVSANAFVDKTSQYADTLLADEKAVVKDDNSMTNAGSVAVTPSVSSKREDTHLIDENNYDNYHSTSCLVVESRSGVTQPTDENYMVKEDFEEELTLVAKTSMTEMSEPSKIQAHAFQENQSFDLLIADNQDTGARPTDSLTIGNIGANAHALESSEAVTVDGCLVTDDLMGPRGFDIADVNIVEDKTSQNAENHLANEKGDTFMAEAGSLVVAPVLASQIEDTHLIDEKIKDTFLVSGTSCLTFETQATVTHPFDDNLIEKGDSVEELIPVVKTSMTMMSEPSETRIPAFQGNQSFDLLIGDNQDTDSHSVETVSEDRCLVNDDLMGPGDRVLADVGSVKVVADVTSQNANIHLVDGSAMVKSHTSLVDEGSVAVAPAVSSQSEYTCMIDKKNHGDCLVTSTSCLVVETQSTATHPLDDNLIKNGDFVEELIPSVKTIMLEMLKPPEIRAITFQGNQSCDLLTPDNVDPGDFPVGSFVNGDIGTDAHNVESSLGSDQLVVEPNFFKETLPMPDKLEVQLVQRSEAEGPTSAMCDSTTDGIVDASALHIGEQEQLESSEKQILQRVPLVPWTKYTESNQPVRYNLPPQDTKKFSVSDLVWGKVRSHPWWPGQIFDHSDASDLALKHQRKDNFLVAYFEDRTFAWRDKSQLKPFYTNFSQLEKQSNSEAFKYAIMEVLGEASRRMELGMTCSCFSEKYAAKKCQEVVNAGVREGTDNSFFDRSLVMNFFQPSRHLEYIKALAQIPIAGADRLELVIAKAQLKAFYLSKGYCELPEFVVGGGLIENDIDVSPSCDRKPTDVAPDHSILLSSELVPGKRKRGRPPKQQKHISGETSSSDKKPTEVAVEHSTPLSSELLPRMQKGGRPSKKQKYMAEEISPSSNKILTNIETTVEYSTPLSSELVPGKRKRGRPSKKQKDIFGEISTSSDKKSTETAVEHSTPSSSELVPGKRKRGRPSKKQKDMFGEIPVLKPTETAVEHYTPLSSELVPWKRKRGRPPKKQEHIFEDFRKQESSSEEMEEINVSRGGKSGSGVKSAVLNLCSSGKKCKVVDSGSAELGKTKKKRLDSLNDLGTKLASPNLGRSFDVESLDNPGENKRKNDSVAGLGTKSSALGSSFKVGEYIRRVASQLTGSPSIFKCHDETFHKSVSKADRRGGGVNLDTFSQNMRKRKTKKGISGDYSSADELLSKLFLAARDPLEGYSFLSVLVSFFADFRNSYASGSSEASEHSAKMGDKRDGKEAFDSDSGDSDTSTPDHMKDSYWSDMISDKSSGKGLSSGLKRKGETDMQNQRKKKKKLIGESSPSYLLGETARHLQLGTLCPNMKPALSSERSIISVEERIVDTPTALVLSFSSSDYLPSEADLFRIFGIYGPLRESETEILRKTKCVKVVFKRRADAETAFSSAGKFSIFGPALVSYQLKYSPSTLETSSDYSPQGTNEAASTKVAQAET